MEKKRLVQLVLPKARSSERREEPASAVRALNEPLVMRPDPGSILSENLFCLGNYAKISVSIFVLDTVLNSIRFSFFTLKMPRS